MKKEKVLLVTAAILVMSGCQSLGLMATPNLYQNPDAVPFDAVPAALRTPTVDVVYGTDRSPESDTETVVGYNSGRAPMLAYGVGTVSLGEDLTWDKLVEVSTGTWRKQMYFPKLTHVNQFGYTPDILSGFEVVGGEILPGAAMLAAEEKINEDVCALLEERLQHTARKEVFLFIHGYNAQFDESLITIAEIWHFLGRQGVPVAYSWPAGRGGIRGYSSDRESGEFTVFHLKQFLRAAFNCNAVDKLHILAHSRGTDVALTAIRELYLETKHVPEQQGWRSKLGNLILAAPDIDLDVVMQRVAAEGLFHVPERLTVYLSPEDRAMIVAGWLFDSVRRLGRLRSIDLTDAQRAALAALPQIQLVDGNVERVDFFGHSYFYDHPAVSSDLMLLLRDNKDPGVENGRPLKPLAPGFWLLQEGYPNVAPPEKAGIDAK